MDGKSIFFFRLSLLALEYNQVDREEYIFMCLGMGLEGMVLWLRGHVS